MHHTMGVIFMSDEQFKFAFWRIFPEKMQEWLTNDQNKDPYDRANPLDVYEIANHMQRYWNTYLNQVKNDDKAKTDNSMEGNNPGAEKQESQKKTNRKKTNGKPKAEEFEKSAKKKRNCCPIAEHDRYHHDWNGCFLNPHSHKFDFVSAKRFYERTASRHSNDSWYRSVYEAMQGNQYHDEDSYFHGDY